MTRNTFFAAMMFAFMAMVSNNMNAQGRVHRGEGRGYNIEMGHNRNGMGGRHDEMGRHDMDRRNDDYAFDARNDRHFGEPRMGRGHHDNFREMHGHRWDNDGWLEGYYGRVRHFDDGRWGYFRDNAWYYYDSFFEPDYYFAHPVMHFESHLFSPRARHAVGAAVGVVAVAALIGALLD